MNNAHDEAAARIAREINAGEIPTPRKQAQK